MRQGDNLTVNTEECFVEAFANHVYKLTFAQGLLNR